MLVGMSLPPISSGSTCCFTVWFFIHQAWKYGHETLDTEIVIRVVFAHGVPTNGSHLTTVAPRVLLLCVRWKRSSTTWSSYFLSHYCWWFRNPKQPLFGCIKPCKYWDKLPTSTGACRISEPSTVYIYICTACFIHSKWWSQDFSSPSTVEFLTRLGVNSRMFGVSLSNPTLESTGFKGSLVSRLDVYNKITWKFPEKWWDNSLPFQNHPHFAGASHVICEGFWSFAVGFLGRWGNCMVFATWLRDVSGF